MGRSWLARRAVVVLAAALAAACTSSPRPVPAVTSPPPPGSIVAFTRSVGAGPLVAFDVRRTTVRSVGGSVREPVASAAAVVGGRLTGVVVSSKGTATVVSLGAGGAARSLGPALEGPSTAPYRSVGVAGGRAIVANCRVVGVLDTASASRWQDVGTGCWAALSPDGSRVVFSPDGVHVVGRGVPSGSARPMFDVSRLDLGTGAPTRLYGAPAWGPAGIAFAAVSADQAAICLARPDGSIDVLLREPLLKTVRPPVLAWQPGGDLLGAMDDLATGGVLRTFDPSSGVHRVVALDPLSFNGLVWSPDGSSLATLTSAGFLLVVGTDGGWRARVDTTWTSMLGWVA